MNFEEFTPPSEEHFKHIMQDEVKAVKARVKGRIEARQKKDQVARRSNN